MTLQILEKSSIKTSAVLMESELQQQDLKSIEASPHQPFGFSYRFTDAMLMGADLKTVGKYLDAHQGWFTRCAHPMQVNSLGQNGYAITIGKFNSCGYVVEPKVGLELLPQESGVYRIRTINIPDYTPPGYEVSFNAQMRLVETINGTTLGTKVEWDLDLSVYIQFPKFIYKLPKKVIQGTGDNVLKQIVTQVSRRLTHKVQQDFHGNLGLKIPKC
jgi:Protein of unknown function (DUF1997)